MPTDKTLTWYFDYISPFAYLQFTQLKKLSGDHRIEYRPVLFAGLLKHWGTVGPAETPSKRLFTYRHTQWMASRLGVPFTMPSSHPFNPLPLLRLTIASGCNREVIQALYEYVWKDGFTPADEQQFGTLRESALFAAGTRSIDDDDVKQQLIRNTEDAAAAGVFGVPTFEVDGHLFWGVDAGDMMTDYLNQPQMFESAEMRRIDTLESSATRK